MFLNCRITADSSVTKLYLGRPWRAYAKTVFVQCQLAACIAPEGWNNWNNPDNEKTTYYAEYRNSGPGSKINGRAAWSRQLNDGEAKEYRLDVVLGDSNTSGMAWYDIPSKPFDWPAKKN